MSNNNRNRNDPRNIILRRKNEGLKASLSFNNFNIYSNSNISYSIENTINNLLRRMSDISFESPSQNQNKKNSKERKYNFINVNNYFNPQINIIKVNKLKMNINKKNKNEKENKLVNKKNFNKNKSNNENVNLKKIKLIQLWWKEINKLIIIQKHLRGFLFRNKLLKVLEKEEKFLYNIISLYKIIKKIIAKYVFKQIKEYFCAITKKNYYTFYYLNNYINNKKLKYNKNKNLLSNHLSINKRKQNNIESTNINFISKNSKREIKSIPSFQKTVNNFKKIRDRENNHILLSLNKSSSKNKGNYLDKRNNYIKTFGNSNSNKKNPINSIYIENNNKRKKKTSIKSRNLEYTNNNYFNSNKNIITVNNKYSLLNKNNLTKLVNKNYALNTHVSKPKKSIKKKFKNNLIMNNSYSDRNTFNCKLLLNYNGLKNNIIESNFIRTQHAVKIKYYFSLWKEIAEKKLIIQKIKNYLYNNNYRKKNINHKTNADKANYEFKKFKNKLKDKGIGLLIKKILNKCTLYKYFLLFNYYTEKIKIFKKLASYVKTKYHSKIRKNRIRKSTGNTTIEKNKLYPITKRLTNKTKQLNSNNNLSLSTSHISIKKMKSLVNNGKNKNITNKNENQQKIKINRCLYTKLFKKENQGENNQLNSNILNLESNTMQINQLKMIFNLIELKSKRKKTLNYYFNKWKNIIYYKSNKLKNNNPYIKIYNGGSNSYRNKIYSKIQYKSKSDYNLHIKYFLNDTNTKKKKKNNMIYKKKVFSNRSKSKTSRNNNSRDDYYYSSLIEFKKFINNEGIKYENSYNNLSITKNIFNPILKTIDCSSFTERFYKRINKIEEREIFFNKTVKTNNEFNISSLRNEDSNDEIENRSKPKDNNTFYGNFFIAKNLINKFNSKKPKKAKNKSFDSIKRGHYYNFFIRLLIPRKKTL